MSQENVEVVRRAYEALARRDTDALDASALRLAPQFEFESALTGQTYRGAQGLRNLAADLWATVDYAPEVEELIDADNHVMVTLQISGRGTSSGASVAQHVVIVFTFEGDQLVRGKSFTSRAQALEAAGLRE